MFILFLHLQLCDLRPRLPRSGSHCLHLGDRERFLLAELVVRLRLSRCPFHAALGLFQAYMSCSFTWSNKNKGPTMGI